MLIEREFNVKDAAGEEERTIKASVDLSKLTNEDIREYAMRSIVIDLQRILRTGKAHIDIVYTADGSVVYTVPKPGTGRVKKPTDKKIFELVAKLLNKPVEEVTLQDVIKVIGE